MIIEFLQSLKQRVENNEISGATVRDYVKPIRLFCEMNETTVPWKKIMRGLPRSRNYANDRAPTIDEIKKITGSPDKTNQAYRLSDGFIRIRLGAWDYLKRRHLVPIVRDDKIIAANLDGTRRRWR